MLRLYPASLWSLICTYTLNFTYGLHSKYVAKQSVMYLTTHCTCRIIWQQIRAKTAEQSNTYTVQLKDNLILMGNAHVCPLELHMCKIEFCAGNPKLHVANSDRHGYGLHEHPLQAALHTSNTGM